MKVVMLFAVALAIAGRMFGLFRRAQHAER